MKITQIQIDGRKHLLAIITALDDGGNGVNDELGAAAVSDLLEDHAVAICTAAVAVGLLFNVCETFDVDLAGMLKPGYVGNE